MRSETSYGIIPIQYRDQIPYLLLIQHHSGFWGFPKGHKEKDESDIDSASRELLEETGLKVVSLISSKPLSEKYKFRFKGEFIDKTVVYYLAIVDGILKIQTEEVKQAKWVPVTQAEQLATYSEGKALVREVIKAL